MTEDYNISVFRRKSFLKSEHEKSYKNVSFIDLISTKINGFEPLFHSFLSTICCIFRRPDIVHVHNIGPGMFIPLLKLARIKVVLTYHSPNYEHKKWNRFARWMLKIGEKLSTNYADTIIFVNRLYLDKFSNTVRKKSFYIPNGVETNFKSTETNYIEKYGLLKNQYIFTVGRITQEKGFDYLIDSFASLSSSLGTNYKLVIAGGADHKTSYSSSLLKKAEDNNVIMTGFIEGEELKQLYSHAKLFVLPSYNEGFPLALLEAISYGLDVLVSNIPTCFALGLSEDSYFEAGNQESLAKMIMYKLNNSFVQEYDLSSYRWKNIAAQTCKVYQQVMNNYKIDLQFCVNKI